MKMNFDIFLDIASTTFKFSGNVHFINCHAKYYGCVSTGRDATPRVPILTVTPVCMQSRRHPNRCILRFLKGITKLILLSRLVGSKVYISLSHYPNKIDYVFTINCFIRENCY